MYDVAALQDAQTGIDRLHIDAAFNADSCDIKLLPDSSGA
jgi:hypothetical protein